MCYFIVKWAISGVIKVSVRLDPHEATAPSLRDKISFHIGFVKLKLMFQE